MAGLTQDQVDIIEAVKRVANELGEEPLSRREFLRRSGITERRLDVAFRDGWVEAVRLAGLPPHPARRDPRTDDLLLEEYHRVVQRLGVIPPWRKFGAESQQVDSGTLLRRFGKTKGVLERYRSYLEARDPQSPLLQVIAARLSAGVDEDEDEIDASTSLRFRGA